MEITPVSRGKHTKLAGDKFPEQDSSKDSQALALKLFPLTRLQQEHCLPEQPLSL